jgi:hypothetical protein
MSKDPAFLFYSKDWIEGTADLMPDEKGVYIDLLCYQHQRGYLPLETERLARLVGLGHDEFLKIWKILEAKFNRTVDGMVNQRLSKEVEARKQKGLKNTVIGTFASLLRLGKFTKAQYLHLKKNFDPKEFENIEKEKITERLTEWLGLCLKSIENENEDEIIIIDDSVNEVKDKKKQNFNFKKSLIEYGFKEELVNDWLIVRKNKRLTNTETSFNRFIKEIEKANYDKNQILEIVVCKSWGGFEAVWNWKDELKENNKKINTSELWNQ